MNLHEEELIPFVLLVILMRLMAVGKLTVSPIRVKMVPNLTGLGLEWLGEEQITGVEFLYVLVQMILKEKVLMV